VYYGLQTRGERPKSNVPRLEIVEQHDQITQRPAQAVEFPHDQRIPGLQRGKAPRQLRTLYMCAGGLVGEDALAPCPLQRGQLQIGILIVGGDASIADFHAAILTLISDACKRLFLQGGKPASKS
jgi:hypothetical protein